LRQADPVAVRELAHKHAVPELVARLLSLRGHRAGDATTRHLEAACTRSTIRAELPGMREATTRIAAAVARGERILVHGDYDVDGVPGRRS
jgi:single-stranded-DNA-specific exonuclease